MKTQKLKTLEEYKEWLNEKMFDDAMEGRIKGTDVYRRIEYQCEIYILDPEGNVIDECTANYDEKWKKMKEFVKRIYDEGKQEEYTVYYVESERHDSEYYDPEVMKQWRKNGIESHIHNLEKEKEAEENRKRIYARWEEACKWAADNGCAMKIKYNTRQRTIEQIVKNRLEDDWNELFPEFKIEESYVQQLREYWGRKRR